MPNIVKNTTFISLIDLLAPHSCRGCGSLGDPLCDRCKKHIVKNHRNHCPICAAPTPTGQCPNCQGLPPIFVVGNRTDLIGQLIHDLKYQSIRALARPLANILNATLPPIQTPSVIVPLPTINRHIRERGFDHTRLIAKHFAKLRPSCTLQNLLIRNQNTVQVGSNRDIRLAQATSAYALNPTITICPDFTYILFDDVWTTGASMQSAYSLLKKTGIKNIILVILALSK